MAQNFIACDREQELLLPPSLREWLPRDHFAWFVLDAVGAMDLAAFFAAYRRESQPPRLHPRAAWPGQGSQNDAEVQTDAQDETLREQLADPDRRLHALEGRLRSQAGLHVVIRADTSMPASSSTAGDAT